uniref:CX domain-containing protein n=1 Tax=Caenorhabditis japonica TaxID=281687 RepID=A0A8R1DP22_CAEJA
MSRLLFLPVLFTAAEPISSGSTDTDFLVRLINRKVIQEPSHPVCHQGIAYYWLGQYAPSSELPQTCILLSTHPDWPFDGHIFVNGSHPTAVLFGCRMGHMCRGKTCHEPLTYFNVVTYCLMGMILFLLVCLCGGEPVEQTRKVSQLQISRQSSFENIAPIGQIGG